MSDDPVARFEDLLSSSPFVFLVYYRGHWCPFCMSYLKSLKTLTPDITSPPNSGAILAVTSEPSQHLDATRKSSGYQGEVIVDVENKLAAYLKEKGWLDVAVSKKGGYDRGMAQPAVLVLRKKGQDVEVLYSWAIVPGTMNLGGAKDRPIPEQIWKHVVEPKLKGQGTKIDESKIRRTSAGGLLMAKIFG